KISKFLAQVLAIFEKLLPRHCSCVAELLPSTVPHEAEATDEVTVPTRAVIRALTLENGHFEASSHRWRHCWHVELCLIIVDHL
ncbi:Viral coat protein subunit, partial [Parasponia andersonii]